MSYSVTERPRVAGWIAGILAMGLLVGMSVILWTATSATAAPDGPEKVYALTTSDNLLRFDGDNPQMVNKKKITGLVGGESLVGIDFRPSAQAPSTEQGTLYGIGDQSYIYTIDPMTAVATRGLQITADGTPVALEGTSFGIDFNPAVDRLRIVSNTNQNLRVNVDTGVLADFDNDPTNGTQPDLDLQYGTGDPNEGTDPDVTSVAYRNSQPTGFGGATELYDIDPATNDMSEQTPPNNGTLVTEGMLGKNVKRFAGFDIVTIGASPAGDKGFAALQPMMNSSSMFYRVNLGTGRIAQIGRIGAAGTDVEGLAIPISQQ